MTEQEARQLYVTTARYWLGANEGSDQHKKIIDTYNSFKPLPRGYKMTYTAPWCAAFASVPGIQLGWTDILPVECSCSRLIELYKAHPYSRWEEHDDYIPQIGDGVIYDWQDGTDYATTDNTGAPDHVGIVINVGSKSFDVIEGNYGNTVKVRIVPINGRYIRGFLLPAFHLKADTGTGDNPSPDRRIAAEYCKSIKVIQGDGKGNYNWQRYITLEDAAQLIYNCIIAFDK